MAESAECPQVEKMAFSIEEAAEIIGICPNSVREQIKRNDGFPHKRVGGRILIPRKALEEWLNQVEQPVYGKYSLIRGRR